MTDCASPLAPTSGPGCSLRLLGGIALVCGARPCELAYEKGRALLAYLAVEHGRDHPRAALAAMFWPELGREGALTNLRQVLHDLRRALDVASAGTPVLRVDRASVRLEPACGLDIDVAAFTAPFPACPETPCAAHCARCMARMKDVAACYRGEFMAGFALPDCPDFEEWLGVQRETMHRRAVDRLALLSDCCERTGSYAEALPFALRLLDLEPWDEAGLRRAMRLLALNRQHGAALARFQAACRAMASELGLRPSEETRALAARIEQGELPGAMPVVIPAPPERRQVTVLACEFAAMGEADPEQALALLDAPMARGVEIVLAHGGFPVRGSDGGLLAYFGFPEADENAARLAVRAGLALVRAGFPGVELRIGIHTGLVVGGDAQQPDAVGSTTAVAMRIGQSAHAGKVVMSAATERLAGGYFTRTRLGARRFPGPTRTIEVFHVDGESGASSRLEAASRLTPLVGRDHEVAELLARWQEVEGGAQRAVLIRGDAGIGKSRLVHALKHAIGHAGFTLRELRCSPEHSQSPFHPLTVLLASTLAFAPGDSAARKLDKLARYVTAHSPMGDPDAVAILAKLLSIPLAPPYREPSLAPQHLRERTLTLLLGRVRQLAARQPLLLVVEDLHWADPSTLELLERLVTRERPASTFSVFTARPGFLPPWPASDVSILTLDVLTAAETERLAVSAAPGLAPEVLRQVVERADGVPLFAEELAREAAEGSGSAIPSSLQDLLAARLDGMGQAKRVAQHAAAIGREFDVDLLHRAVPVDETTLERHLRQLRDAGLICEEPSGMQAFRHSLIRDAAYQSLTRADRQAIHRHIAAALEEADAPSRPERLAQHWASGGEIRRAVGAWIAAGQLAVQHCASREAVAHFRSGLALLDSLSEGDERPRLELDLQIGLGAALCAAEGYASAPGAAAYARAMTLCRERAGPGMFRSVWGLWASASSRAGYAAALELARQLVDLADDSRDAVETQQAHFALGDTLFWLGEFSAARAHLDRAVAGYRVAHHESHVTGFGEDAGVTAAAYLSWVEWYLGFPARARRASMQSLVLARGLAHPFSLAYALTFAAILHCRMREPATALALAEETLSLARRHGFTLWEIGAALARGWARALQGEEDGIESLRYCVEATRAAMGGVTLVVLGPLADACVALGRHDEALRVIAEAFDIADTLGDHHVDAELHRLRGHALAALGNHAEAGASLLQALAVSRRQGARSLELRAAIDLARLGQAEGRHTLKTVHAAFTEGLDTPDLVEARKLLAHPPTADS